MSENKKKENKILDKAKRVFALVGAVLLALMYILTLVFALSDNPETMSLFKASLVLTIILPVFLYGYQLVYRVLKNAGNNPVRMEDTNSEGDK